MPYFSADPEKCKADGICASVCPVHAIKGPKGEIPHMRPGAEDSCLACGHCIAFCPHGAAHVDVLPETDMHRINKKLLPSSESAEMLFAARRSIRHFTGEAVPKDLLHQILASARHAPSAKNMRPVRFVVIHDKDKLHQLGDAFAEWLKDCMGNPEFVATFPEAKALYRAWRMGLDPVFRGAPHLVLAVTPKSAGFGPQDAAIALTYLELAAVPHNVGACWAGYVTKAAAHYQPIRDMLGIQDDEQVQGGQMMGFIALRPRAFAPRNPLPETWL